MTAREMTEAAESILDSLSDEQRASVTLPLDDARRELWMYWPREMSGDVYVGLPLDAMSFEQRKRVMRLVTVAVTYPTLAQITAIMALDTPLDVFESYRDTVLRDPQRYWLTIYGDPGTGSWSWQFEGHHVSLNHTLLDGEVVASTPLFLGANPARIEKNGYVVTRPCGPEEDAARALLGSLDDDSRRVAVLDAPAPIDMVIHRLSEVPQRLAPGEVPHPLTWFQAMYMSLSDRERETLALDLDAPVGVRRGDLAAVGRRLLDDLVDVYLDRLPEDLAGSERARLEDAGLDSIHFAWAGPDSPGAPHYYRLQGPTFLVEYDCVQDDANHIHAVWRDPKRDFGRDPLRAHRAAAH